MHGDVLIAVASWEERFAAGTERSLGLGGVSDVICLASTRYAGETRAASDRVRQACDYAGARFDRREVDFEDQVTTYRLISAIAAGENVGAARDVIFDLSTAPRSVTWMVLGALRRVRSSIVVRYHRALEYGDWQTTEEGEPKLIINRSGIMYPDLPTCLVMLCGPEISRAEKLCYRFEPKKALVLRDPLAAQFGSVKNLPQDYADVSEEIVFDNKVFSDDNLDTLEQTIRPYLDNHNIVAASLGPKLGALVLFRLSERHEGVALSYVTSGKHNLAATRGIGDMHDFPLDFLRSPDGS